MLRKTPRKFQELVYVSREEKIERRIFASFSLGKKEALDRSVVNNYLLLKSVIAGGIVERMQRRDKKIESRDCET